MAKKDDISFAQQHIEMLESLDNKRWLLVQAFSKKQRRESVTLFQELCHTNRYRGYRLIEISIVNESNFREDLIVERPANIVKAASSSLGLDDKGKPGSRKKLEWQTILPCSPLRRVSASFLVSTIVSALLTTIALAFLGQIGLLRSTPTEMMVGFFIFIFFLGVFMQMLESRYKIRNDLNKKGPILALARGFFRILSEKIYRPREENDKEDDNSILTSIANFLSGKRDNFESKAKSLEETREKERKARNLLKKLEDDTPSEDEENQFENLINDTEEKDEALRASLEEAHALGKNTLDALMAQFITAPSAPPKKMFLYSLFLFCMGFVEHLLKEKILKQDLIGSSRAVLLSHIDLKEISESPESLQKLINKNDKLKIHDKDKISSQGAFVADQFKKNDGTVRPALIDETYNTLEQWSKATSESLLDKNKDKYIAVLQPLNMSVKSEEWASFRGIIIETLHYVYERGILYEETSEGFVFVFYDPDIAINFCFGVYENFFEENVEEIELNLRGIVSFWPPEISEIAEALSPSIQRFSIIDDNTFIVDKKTIQDLIETDSTEKVAVPISLPSTDKWLTLHFSDRFQAGKVPIKDK